MWSTRQFGVSVQDSNLILGVGMVLVTLFRKQENMFLGFLHYQLPARQVQLLDILLTNCRRESGLLTVGIVPLLYLTTKKKRL